MDIRGLENRPMLLLLLLIFHVEAVDCATIFIHKIGGVELDYFGLKSDLFGIFTVWFDELENSI